MTQRGRILALLDELRYLAEAIQQKPAFLFLGVICAQALGLLVQRIDLIERLLRALAQHPVTMPVSLTITMLIMGMTASYWKRSAQTSYGITEVAFGALVSFNLIRHFGTSPDFSKALAVLSAVYLIGRGFNNISESVKALPPIVRRSGQIVVVKDCAGAIVYHDKHVRIESDVRVEGKICARSVSVENSAVIYGNVCAEQGVSLLDDARVLGSIEAGGLLSLGLGSRVDGDTRGKSIKVGYNATIGGNATAKTEIRLGEKAQVLGCVDCETVFLDDGSYVEGGVYARYYASISDRSHVAGPVRDRLEW